MTSGRWSSPWLARFGTSLLIALSVSACGGSETSSGALQDEARAGAAVGGALGAGSGGAPRGGESAGGRSQAGTQAGGASGGVASGGVATTFEACDGSGPQSIPVRAPGPMSGGACRSSSDCSGGQCVQTVPTSGAAVCGACFPTVRECSSDAQCAAEQVCVTLPPGNCQCMGPDMRCTAKCTADSCDSAHVCGADGRCALKSCEQGYGCSGGTVCDPKRAGGDGHGCAAPLCDLGETTCGAEEVCDATATSATHCRPKRCREGAVCPKNLRCGAATDFCERLACKTDTDCDCGVCIQGVCREHPFVCWLPPA